MNSKLLEHNQKAYESVVSMFSEKNRAAVIQPAGMDKSFIGLSLCRDNPDKNILWLSSSEPAFRNQTENFNYSMNNLTFMTFSDFVSEDKNSVLHIRPDFCICETYNISEESSCRCCLSRMGEIFSDVPAIGLFSPDMHHIAEEFFSGCTASEVSLADAVVLGIFTPPKYIVSFGSSSSELEKYEKYVLPAENQSLPENACTDILRKIAENKDSADFIFGKYIDRCGKYTVFFSDGKSADKYVSLLKKYFISVNGNIHLYSVSGDSSEEGISSFRNDKSDCLRVLFCTDRLIEDVDCKDISAVILIRFSSPSVSYENLIAKALSLSQPPVIFDIVDNIGNLFSIDSIAEGMHDTALRLRSEGKNNLIAYESFEIADKPQGCREFFRYLKNTLTVAWNKYYSAAQNYYHSRLSLDVSAGFVTKDGIKLGEWLAQLRAYRKIGLYSSYLTPERIAMLDKIGMLWDVYDYVFERSYHAAAEYYKKHGDLECDSGYVTHDGIRLGAWLQYLRVQYKQDSSFLTDEQYLMLNAIGMRWGGKYDLKWDEAYAQLCEYYRFNGNINISAAYTAENGLQLGRWIRRQTELYAKNKLRPDRIERLEKLGIVWNIPGSWEKIFSLAKAYSDENNGLDNMPENYTVNGIRLGKWLSEQKSSGEGRRKKHLTVQQRQKLESIGLVFGKSKNDTAWYERFSEAQKYYNSNGNLNVPDGYKDSSGRNLSVWICRQRESYFSGKLSDEQINLLNSIGMVWDIYAERWKQMYRNALLFYKENGNLRIPPKYRTDNGKDLYDWLQRQKKQYRTGKLSDDKIKLLRQIGLDFGQNPAAEVRRN